MHTLLNYHVWKNIRDEFKNNFKDAQIVINGNVSNPIKLISNENSGVFFNKFNNVYPDEETNIRNGYGDADQFRAWSRLPSILSKENDSLRDRKKKFLKEIIDNNSSINNFNKIRYEHDGHATPDTAMLTSRHYLKECKRLYYLALTQSGDTRKETLFESAKYLSYCLHFLEDILCPVHNRRVFANSKGEPTKLSNFHDIYETPSNFLENTITNKSLSELHEFIEKSPTPTYKFTSIDKYGEDVFYNDIVTKQLLKSSNELITIMINKANDPDKKVHMKECYIRDIKQSFHYLMQYLKGSVIRDFFPGSNSSSLERKSLVPFAEVMSGKRFELSNGFKIEYGKKDIPSNDTSTKTVSFDSNFSTIPVVLVSSNIINPNNGNVRATSVTKSGFNISNKKSKNPSFVASYIAIGG